MQYFSCLFLRERGISAVPRISFVPFGIIIALLAAILLYISFTLAAGLPSGMAVILDAASFISAFALLLLSVAVPMAIWFHERSILDEQEFYWRRHHTNQIRMAVITATCNAALILLLLLLLLEPLSFGVFLSATLACLWWLACIARFFSVQFNHRLVFGFGTGATVLLIVSLVLFFLRWSMAWQLILAGVLLPAAWFALSDQRAIAGINRTLARESEPEEIERLVEQLFYAGDKRSAKRCLARYGKVLPLPAILRIMNHAQLFFESLDIGLARESNNLQNEAYLLAMAEASFGARDSESGVAYAEAAIDEAGVLASETAQEAHLLRALAAFNQMEQATAIVSCQAVLNGPRPSTPRSKRIFRECRLLMRTFAIQDMD